MPGTAATVLAMNPVLGCGASQVRECDGGDGLRWTTGWRGNVTERNPYDGEQICTDKYTYRGSSEADEKVSDEGIVERFVEFAVPSCTSHCFDDKQLESSYDDARN
ncbi:hypothetical protein FISHEDRAFT_62286 [Fistulina hepatica ATCC 64428]|nr:hypothetical protein FISHEDRAFT_62286 [Fistulina hepatica ATCC 64428]